MPDTGRASIWAQLCSVTGESALRADAYTMLIATEGLCRIVTPQREVSMRAGEALLLQPNTDYTLASCEEMQAVHIAFNREGFYRSCLSVIEGCPMLAGFP